MQAKTSFETGHVDQIHDCQYDYYGRRVATCSSDRTIKIFDTGSAASSSSSAINALGENNNNNDFGGNVGGNNNNFGVQHPANVVTLTGHEGPVWQVSWAHPKFGALLASCSFDHTVMIWKETSANVFSRVYVTPKGFFDGSVNAISWAPHEFGCALAACASDGSCAVVSNVHNQGWTSEKISDAAHAVGCTGISWGQNDEIASCGCDNLCKIWTRQTENNNSNMNNNNNNYNQKWRLKKELRGHSDWVRDIQWAPNNGGSPVHQIASCSQDGKVLIWTPRSSISSTRRDDDDDSSSSSYVSILLNDFKTSVWRLSWSVVGNVLAVSDANNNVSVWKESVDGKWCEVKNI